MSNYIEYNGKVAFHPGYYIHELVEDSGLTQEEFAKRLDTTPKNLSILIRGEQSLSTDMALKLSRMFGTSINYWLNLQVNYDELIAEMKSLPINELDDEMAELLFHTVRKLEGITDEAFAQLYITPDSMMDD